MTVKKPDEKGIGGEMTVEITINEVTIVITGPVVKVLAVLQWLFGAKEPDTLISKLQLVFGPEVSVKSTS